MGHPESEQLARRTSLDPWLVPLTLLGSLAAMLCGWTWEDMNSISVSSSVDEQLTSLFQWSGVAMFFPCTMLLLGLVYSVTPLGRRLPSYFLAGLLIVLTFFLAAGLGRASEVFNKSWRPVQTMQEIIISLATIAISVVLASAVINSMLLPLRWLTVRNKGDQSFANAYRPSRFRFLAGLIALLLVWALVQSKTLLADLPMMFIVGGVVTSVILHGLMLLLSLTNSNRWLSLLLGGLLLTLGVVLSVGIFHWSLSLQLQRIVVVGIGVAGYAAALHWSLFLGGRLPLILKSSRTDGDRVVNPPSPKPRIKLLRLLPIPLATFLLLGAHFMPLYDDLPLRITLGSAGADVAPLTARLRQLHGHLLIENPNASQRPRLTIQGTGFSANVFCVVDEAELQNIQPLKSLVNHFENLGTPIFFSVSGYHHSVESLQLFAPNSNWIQIDGSDLNPADLSTFQSLPLYSNVEFKNLTVDRVWLQKFPSAEYIFTECQISDTLSPLDFATPVRQIRIRSCPLTEEKLQQIHAICKNWTWTLSAPEEIQLGESMLLDYLASRPLVIQNESGPAKLERFIQRLTVHSRSLNYSDKTIKMLTDQLQSKSNQGSWNSIIIEKVKYGDELEWVPNLEHAAFATDDQGRLLRYSPAADSWCVPSLDWQELDLSVVKKLDLTQVPWGALERLDIGQLRLPLLEELSLSTPNLVWTKNFLADCVPQDQLKSLTITAPMSTYLPSAKPWRRMKHLRVNTQGSNLQSCLAQIKTAGQLETLTILIDSNTIDYSETGMKVLKSSWSNWLRQAGIQAKTTLVLHPPQLLGTTQFWDDQLKLELDPDLETDREATAEE